ncbi:MAG: GHMP kinase [Candidatus Nealsonbacteria bacterium]|nr:GHMP kinase [Candidatus Nealsonbacteria bacterium]
MQLIRKKAYARAGLIGNPSDGYGGKTLALVVRNFAADVVLYEWDRIEVVFSENDQTRFESVDELVRDVQLHGYYGGIRLVKATIKKFVEYCRRGGHRLHDRNFSVRYETNIPRCVGMAGSSAIITATLRCLMEFYGIEIPKQVLPSLVLSVEMNELGIAAGLQDRVVQAYEGLVYMDFASEKMHKQNGLLCGEYEPLDANLLPPLYLAFGLDEGEPTERLHGDLRTRFEQGDAKVRDAMGRFAELTVEARDVLLAGETVTPGVTDRLGPLLDENFDLRRSICDLPPGQIRMIETARAAGASAKFAGSGGAIIGTCEDEATFERLRTDLGELGCEVLRPIIEP